MRAVGVDFGGSNVRAALIDVATGQRLGADAKRAVPTDDKTVDHMVELVAQVVAEVDPHHERVGVGIGFAGMLRGWTGIVVNAPNFGWREVDFRGALRARVDPTLEMYNDLKAITYGEFRYGGARGTDDVLCVYVGTGVGSGIIARGRLYIGQSHLAGEIGHIKVVPGGRLCGCGRHGCLEAYTSGRNIQKRAQEELSQGAHSLAVELAGAVDKVHAGHLEDAAARGDAYACQLWDQVALHLGTSLANAVTLLNPARLVMGGGVWQKSPELRRRALAAFDEALNPPHAEGFAIVDTTLGDDAGVLGSAALIVASPIKETTS